MTTKEFIQRVSRIQNYLLSDFYKDIVVLGAQNLKKKIENRVRMTETLSDGSKREYSKKYALFRKDKGHLNKHKNYSFTTDMWTGFGDMKKGKTVILGGTNDDSQDKINWNSRRDEINIIASTEKEEVQLAEFISNNLANYLRATLNS